MSLHHRLVLYVITLQTSPRFTSLQTSPVLYLRHYITYYTQIYVIKLQTTPTCIYPYIMLLSDKSLHYICVLLHYRLLPFIWPLVTDMPMLLNVCWITRRTSHSETLTAITAWIWPSTTTNRESACTSLRDLIPFFYTEA